jgi:hypothetical protein
MQPREAFGVVVRSLGLLAIAYALWNLGFAFSGAIGYAVLVEAAVEDYVTNVVTFTAIALWLLRGADGIVNFAYGRQIPSMPISNT